MSRCKKVQVAKVSMPYGNYKVLTERHMVFYVYRTWYDTEYKKHTNKVAECGSMAEALSTILDTDRAEMLKQADRERWYLIG